MHILLIIKSDLTDIPLCVCVQNKNNIFLLSFRDKIVLINNES